ncbi:hypothetical protein F0266_25660 [Vibrio coralliilyticus]|uniref:hypothetical protein n=1 Tax=Vibrio coralliilyticus TaxID=190893 RepID=UPI00148CCEE5|nr:hypothetical protein [Vibrio coralliilyticus]NOH56299.1 hypothetical protein [Vibrio coralliilyticus]
MSQNCQALTVQLNAWLWEVKTTITLTATHKFFATTERKNQYAATKRSPKKKPNNNDTAN